MPAPLELVPTEYVYNTQLTDKGAGLDKAVSYGLEKGWALVSVIWEKEDEKKHHHFTITYNIQ